MKKILKKIDISFFIIAITVIAAIAAYAYVVYNSKKDLENQTEKHLKSITSEIGKNVDSKLDQKFSVMETFGYTIFDYDNKSGETMNIFEKNCAKRENMTSIDIIPYDQSLVPNDAKAIAIENDYIVMYAPIIDEQSGTKIIVKAVYTKQQFSDIVILNAFEQSDNNYILTREGKIVCGKSNKLKEISDIFTDTYYSTKITNSIQSKNTGNVIYNVDNQKRYICYSKISYNNWYVITILSDSLVESGYKKVSSRTVLFTFVFICVILFMIIYVVYFYFRYRLYKKIFKERMNIYANHSNLIVSDYKVGHKTISYSKNVIDLLGVKPVKNYFDDEGNINYFTKESSDRIKELYADGLKDIDNFVEINADMLDVNGNTHPVSIKITPIYKKKRLVRVVSSIIA